MASRLFFNGTSYLTPVTVSQINDDAMQPSQPTVGNVLCIIGTANGGQPNTPLAFGNPADVLGTLVSGPLAYAVAKAFAASGDANAPSTVYAIRVGTATPATLATLDLTNSPLMIWTSKQYGLAANAVQIKLETGTLPSTKKLSVQSGTNLWVQDNIGGPALTIAYTGAQPTGVASVGTANTILRANGAVVATLDHKAYTTLTALAAAINVVSGFTATVTPGMEAVDPSKLDAFGGDVRTTPGTWTAINLGLLNAVNNNLVQQLVTVVIDKVTNPLQVDYSAAKNFGWTALSGGTSPATVFQDWVNALTVAQGIDCQQIVPLTGDAAVHAATDAHVQYMSTVARKERRAFVGPVKGTAQTAVTALPLAIDSDRTALCWPGYYDYDTKGVLTLFDPFYTAVLVAAGFAGLNPGKTMTNKLLTVRGLEVNVRNPTDTDQLIRAGVLCVEKTAQGYKVVRAVTTWVANDKYNRVEVSCGYAVDFVARNVRDAVDRERGQPGTRRTLGRALSDAETALKVLAQPEPIGLGVIVGDDKNPAYRNLTGSLAGDVISLAFECSPVIPVNFAAITISINAYSTTITI